MTDTALHLVALGLGIALLIIGGDLLVRGAVTMAVRFGVSTLVVGLTVVAFGTSAPELAFNLIAALQGEADLAFGNIIGSNIANIGLVLGVAALIQPMQVHASVIRREMPFMIALTVLAVGLTMWPTPKGGLLAGGPGLARLDGLILLGAFVLFSALTYLGARSAKRREREATAEFVEEMEQISSKDRERPMPRAVGLFLFGLALLVGGGNLAEEGATGVALELGISDTLIGLTIVAIATSLPEMFVCVLAALKKQADIAVGNVVGSNIFNLALVLGATATATPVPLPERGVEALGWMTLLSLLLLVVARTRGQVLSRVEGAVLLLIYVGVMVHGVMTAVPRVDG
jgi:cation:H+ antiporter